MSSTDGESLYRYQDILRAIGRYVDENGIQDVILLQSEKGILLRGYRTDAGSGTRGPALVEHLFTPADLQEIDEEARKRRGQGSRLMR